MINSIKELIQFAVAVFAIVLLGGFFMYLSEPKYTCVDNKLYYVHKNYLESTNRDCLPIDKD